MDFEACFPDSVVGLIATDEITARYVEFFVRTAKADLSRYAPATAQKNINLEILSEVAVPLPPLAEQFVIVERVDEEMSRIDAVEAVVKGELKRSSRLRQSILKAAFSGKLVSQNPADEPAAALLERIRAEHAAPFRVDRNRLSKSVQTSAAPARNRGGRARTRPR